MVCPPDKAYSKAMLLRTTNQDPRTQKAAAENILCGDFAASTF